MTLRVLRYFLAVAREESIIGAAKLLHITQPTLSKQLMELEEELGKKLFERGNRKITLTDKGIFLRKRAQEVINMVKKIESEFYDSDEELRGDIYIGGARADTLQLISKTAIDLRKKHPDIRYHFFGGNTTSIIERLDNGLLDFGVAAFFDKKKYFHIKLPIIETWGLLMRKDDPFVEYDSIKPEMLRSIPLLYPEQSFVNYEISGWLNDDIEKLNIVALYNLMHNASIMVEAGLGCAVSFMSASTTMASTLCFRPLSPRLETVMSIIWKKNQVFSRVAEKFFEYLQKEVAAANENINLFTNLIGD